MLENQRFDQILENLENQKQLNMQQEDQFRRLGDRVQEDLDKIRDRLREQELITNERESNRLQKIQTRLNTWTDQVEVKINELD